MKRIIKLLFIALGLLALALGTVGIFLPVLPTAPLYLLAGFCFARGSTRFHHWFLGTKLYEKHLAGLVTKRAMPFRTKALVLTLVSVMLAAAVWFAPTWHTQVLIAAVWVWHWWYFLFRIQTAPGGGKK
jgi:uncharacterized membrane protein YbaN (DUF454 family)